MDLNCTELDGVFDDGHSFLVESDLGFAVTVATLLLASGLLLVKGEHVVRAMSAAVAGVGAAGAVFVLSEFVDDVPCVARIGVAGGAGVIAAVLALCLLKTGLFLLGAAGFGVVAHYAYGALPLGDVAPPFVLMGRSGYYYIAIAAAGVVGAVASHWQRTHFVRISSSLLGGGGLAWTVHLVAERSDSTIPALALLSVLLVSTTGGVVTQHYLAKQRRRPRQRVDDEDRSRV